MSVRRPGRAGDEAPIGYSVVKGRVVCLSCRRRRVREAAEGPGVSKADVVRALIRDELDRDPERSDAAIAKALGGSARAVRDVRRLLRDDRRP